MSQPNADNIARFSGFADCYDAFRPSPPSAMADLLIQLSKAARPRLVVDIGCGTGLSTRIWAEKAQSVIGIEPNADMRLQAQRQTACTAISYRPGSSSQTGLEDACADIVTCCQSLHWMQPEPTFAEISRILRPNGVFAACDADWPPSMNCRAEAANIAFAAQVQRLEKQHGCSAGVQRWAKQEHLGRIKASGHFRFVKEVLLHQVEMGNAQRLVGLAKSRGSVEALLRAGLSEQQIGLTELGRIAQQELGEEPAPWYFSFRVRLGVKNV
jgi:ubiquinone/menaquinone biosynthesis C-methylase UbiE